MSVAIHATEKPLAKVFSNDFAFSIPAYQRPYAWTTEEAGELLADLLSFLGDGSESVADANPYFLGSIVLIKSDDAPEADVVDGQQRLTTLTILLAVLKSLVSSKNSSHITKYIYREADIFAGVDANYRLKLRERDEEFFCKYIQNAESLDDLLALNASLLTDSQKNIQANARHLIEELKKIDEPKLEKFIQYLITRCFLVVVSTPDIDSAYRIFSVLNSRGLDLSLPDLLKSDIIGAISSSEQEKYTKIWEGEEEDLGRDTFKELFSHIRMICRKAKLQETALKEFRNHIKPQKEAQKFIDDVLKPYSDALENIKKASYPGDGEDAKVINSLFRWLNQIDNFDWIPPAILYFSQNYHKPDKLRRFFTDLERLAAGLMILRADINARTSRYIKLLTAIEDGADLYAVDSPLQVSSDECDRIIKTLDGDLYLIYKISRYVLLRLDSALSDGAASHDHSVVTIEHVLPQNPKQDSIWLKCFPNEEERIQYVHRIGNLVLLSRKKNSEAQNFDFEKKKKKYFFSGTGISAFALTSQVLYQTEWTPEVINQRQESSLQNLRKIWRL
jgi:hypothetical protein